MRQENGFTLLEVLVALAILAVALPVLLTLRNRDARLLDEARMITTATLLAQEKLFETQLLGYPQPGEQIGDFVSAPPGFPLGTDIRDRAPGFRWMRRVSPTTHDALQEIRIRVSWLHGETEEAVDVVHYAFKEPPPPPDTAPGAVQVPR
jgi:general secretion pathway protein I